MTDELRERVEAAIYADAEGVDDEERATILAALLPIIEAECDTAYRRGRREALTEAADAAYKEAAELLAHWLRNRATGGES